MPSKSIWVFFYIKIKILNFKTVKNVFIFSRRSHTSKKLIFLKDQFQIIKINFFLFLLGLHAHKLFNLCSLSFTLLFFLVLVVKLKFNFLLPICFVLSCLCFIYLEVLVDFILLFFMFLVNFVVGTLTWNNSKLFTFSLMTGCCVE